MSEKKNLTTKETFALAVQNHQKNNLQVARNLYKKILKINPDHFAALHSERTSLDTLHRIFAWMTYLNDVEDGGQTNFSHYGIKIKPEIGKTLIWPAEWTHAHTGEVLKSGKKYMITGWMHFPAPDFKFGK